MRLPRASLCLVLALLAGCATTSPRLRGDQPAPLTLAELKANPALAAELQRAFSRDTPLVLRLECGQTLLLRLELNTPAVTMAPVTGELVFHRDVYLRISAKGLYLSSDGQRWSSIRDVDQTKAILGAEHAALSLAFGALAGQGAGAVLSVNGTAGK